MNGAPAFVTLDRNRTPRQRASVATRAPATPRGRTTGSVIGDMVALGKALTLCATCIGRFDARAHGYMRDRRLPQVLAPCDGCREMGPAVLLTKNGHLRY